MPRIIQQQYAFSFDLLVDGEHKMNIVIHAPDAATAWRNIGMRIMREDIAPDEIRLVGCNIK